MTVPKSGESTYEARIRRAALLSARHSFAREFLDFYKNLVPFQKTQGAKLARAKDLHAGPLAAMEFRKHLDLTLLLPDFRGFLSVLEQHAPPALAGSAHQIARLPSESWVASLEAYWQHAGKYDQQVGAFAQFIPRAFLEPYAEFCGARIQRPPVVGAPRFCPLCGSRPLLGVLRPEGDGGKRFLLCSFCGQEWEFRRLLCPTCGEEAENKLPVYTAEQLPHIRVESCDTCKFYLRTIDLTKDGNAIPLVDDLAAIPLTLWAHEQGYSRLQPNLLGT